ncbi:MAG: D-glycerate dehydrogenase [Phycisphaerales bacterium]
MTIALSRPLPGEFEVEGAEIRTGPMRGFQNPAELAEFMAGAHAVVSWVSERIDGAFLDAVGTQLKVVSNFAVGYDNIDVPACTKRGVIVTNTPDAVTEGTADMAWALILAAARRLAEADLFVRDGSWAGAGVLGPSEFIGRPLSGKTLLIVGAGRIGYATALRSIGWGMRVLYVARTAKPQFEFAPLNAERVSLDEGLERADVVSLHTPLTDETRHLINARSLSIMKETAVLVNTARGKVVDEAALVEALKAGAIFAAGLDVFEDEPRVHPELIGLKNVVLAPHIGSANLDSREMMTRICRENIVRVLGGQAAITPVHA